MNLFIKQLLKDYGYTTIIIARNNWLVIKFLYETKRLADQVVVAIIGILAAIGVVAYNGYIILQKKWSLVNHAKFLKWVFKLLMCVIDESGSVELAQGCKSDKGGYLHYTNILFKIIVIQYEQYLENLFSGT